MTINPTVPIAGATELPSDHVPNKPLSLDLADINRRFAKAEPEAICQWAAETFGSELIMTSSFGAESMCTIHLANQARPGLKIVVVNTGYLFPETLSFMQEMRQRFNLNIWEFHTQNDPIVWLTVHGENDPRVRNDIERCCGANKNEVFDRAMRTIAPGAWIRGVRADQSATRAEMEHVQWSKRNNCYAISPILKWSVRDIHAYMKKHDLPYHPLWELGYTSIGCNPITCTAPIGLGDDNRGGRWSGIDKSECGIHLDDGAGI
jgi:phosphoadenosine phosphosulfate reductase